MPLRQRILARQQEQLGSEHPKVGIANLELAEALHSSGNDREAKFYFERALAGLEKYPDHAPLAFARVHSNLADIYRREGKPAHARVFFQRATSTLDKEAKTPRLYPDPSGPSWNWRIFIVFWENTAKLNDCIKKHLDNEPILKHLILGISVWLCINLDVRSSCKDGTKRPEKKVKKYWRLREASTEAYMK